MFQLIIEHPWTNISWFTINNNQKIFIWATIRPYALKLLNIERISPDSPIANKIKSGEKTFLK